MNEFPANLEVSQMSPVYEEMPGWRSISVVPRAFADLPENAQNYVKRLEELIGCPIVLVSVGAGRDETMILKNPFRINEK